MSTVNIKTWRAFLLCVLWLGCVPMAFGHGGKPHSYQELWGSWAFEPGVIIGLGFSGWLYARGVRRLWRVMQPGHGIRRWEAGCYSLGWLAMFIALVSPLHPWGRVLFSAHMTQHEVLMLVAAPLLVLGRPMIAFFKALPPGWASMFAQAGNTASWRHGWRVISHPFAAWLIHALALWIWHLPVLFEATIDHEWVHAAQHASFLLSALLFWWAIMHGREKLMGYGMAVLYMFTTALHSGLLGALITFAASAIYPSYAATTTSWGLTPLQDQQLGGLIMWIPAGLVYVTAALAMFAAWLGESEKRVQEWEVAGKQI